jgi:plasmid stabilization system protein ParE
MKYRLRFAASARRELRDAFHWIAQRSPGRAQTWQTGAIAAAQSLAELPRRCPIAPESEAFGIEVRQLMYGDYRILFTIDGDTVRILRFRHGARGPLEPDEL